jgi:hypothetical protein
MNTSDNKYSKYSTSRIIMTSNGWVKVQDQIKHSTRIDFTPVLVVVVIILCGLMLVVVK